MTGLKRTVSEASGGRTIFDYHLPGSIIQVIVAMVFWHAATAVASWRRAAKAPPAPDEHEPARQYWHALEPLGPSRQEVIACLWGDSKSSLYCFAPADGQDLFDAFRQFTARQEAAAPPNPDSVYGSILAAGRLLTGDLAGADRIINLLPETPYVTDHGAGKCLRMPARVLYRVLPLPDVGNPDRWTAGSPEQAVLRSWLAQNRGRLIWEEGEGKYKFSA